MTAAIFLFGASAGLFLLATICGACKVSASADRATGCDEAAAPGREGRGRYLDVRV